MPDDTNQTGSFTHAFLPGLILGLVVGAVGGAFLPDLLGGSRIPSASDAPHTGDIPTGPAMRDGMPVGDQPGETIDDAADRASDAMDDAQDATPGSPDEPSQPGG